MARVFEEDWAATESGRKQAKQAEKEAATKAGGRRRSHAA